MIFIANALPMNGGTTFLIRMCRDLNVRGKRPRVLVMFNQVDIALLKELEKWADVSCLSTFSKPMFRRFFNNQAGSFLPLDLRRLDALLEEHDREVHVMGLFGLLFVARMLKRGLSAIKLTVGIYHQNEFMFAGVDYYFSNEARRLFSVLDSQSLIFFNEASRDSHSKFFGVNYVNSTLVPVGVTLPMNVSGGVGDAKSGRIVSIGNLHNFKTYNWHVIKCMREFLKINPKIVYEIYGDGPCRKELEDLAVSLGVQDSVLFKGCIDYSDMDKVLNGAFVFVGSGTAIIEASALGIPSVIGIESSVEPVTYGFLSDAAGYTYHEMVPGRETLSICDVVISIMRDENAWESSSAACILKARDFSITNTVNGFIRAFCHCSYFDCSSVLGYSNLISLLSLSVCAVKNALRIDNAFANRRNQGSIS